MAKGRDIALKSRRRPFLVVPFPVSVSKGTSASLIPPIYTDTELLRNHGTRRDVRYSRPLIQPCLCRSYESEAL